MSMDDITKIIVRSLTRNQGTGLLNDIRCVWTEKVASEDSSRFKRGLATFLRFSSHNDFAEAVGFPHGNRFSIGAEKRLEAFYRNSSFFALVFCLADACCFG